MKHIYLSLVIATFLSCGHNENQSKSLLELNKEKTHLIQQIDSLSTALNKVELQISKLDTTKRLTSVTVFKAIPQNFKHYIEVQGMVEADQNVELHAEHSGTVTKIFVVEGQRVSKGQTLAQIDDSVLRGSINELQTQLDLAKTTFERQERLWQQNIGSELQFLQAKAKKEGLENSLQRLKSEALKLQLTAPFEGTIDDIFIKVGAMASPLMPAIRLVNLKQVHVESEVTESYLKAIKQGSEVGLYFPSIDKKVTSRVSQVGNFINPNNRSFKVRIDLDNNDDSLKANMLADLRINDFQKEGIVIPTELIQKDRNGNTFAYTLEKDSNKFKVKKSYVKATLAYNDLTFIEEGLVPNTLIVDKGARLVKAEENVIVLE